jgi:hypothetical protein
MKARPPLVVRPVFVSQETAFAVLGITPRKFREVLVPMCHGFVVRVGKSALIPVDVAEGKLCLLAVDGHAVDAEDGPGLTDEPPDDEQPQTVDAILHALGRRRGGPRCAGPGYRDPFAFTARCSRLMRGPSTARPGLSHG